jgi:hypothetical protein
LGCGAEGPTIEGHRDELRDRQRRAILKWNSRRT